MQTKTDERMITLKYRSDNLNFDTYTKIKVQGTSSLAYEKKNYTINMYKDSGYSEKSKIDMGKGWGKQSKYCLKANWIDKTHSRNIVSARIAAKVQKKYGLFMDTPNNGVIDGFPVEIYANNEFLGLYTWNIPKDTWLWNLDKNNPNNLAILGDDWTDSTAFKEKVTTFDESKWELEIGPDNQETINKFNRIINFVKNSSDEDFKRDFEQYINKDAALNYFVIMNLIRGTDNTCKNLAMVTYDGNIWYPSLYDLDTTFGTTWQGKKESTYDWIVGTESRLWERLIQAFPNEIAARWYMLRNDLFTKENVINEFENFINSVPEETYNKDSQRWRDIPGYDIDQINEFIEFRLPCFDNYVKNWRTIKTIQVKNLNKTEYIQNYEKLNIDGGKLKIIYNDDTSKEIDLSDPDIYITGFDNRTIGKKTLTVKYAGLSATSEIEIIPKQINSIEIESVPTKKNYIQDYETLDLTGGKIKVKYNDDTTDTINMTNENIRITGFDNSKIGNCEITVEYEEKTVKFNVVIIKKQIIGIQITKNPTKNKYIQNYEEIDLTGGIITVTYNNQSTDTMSMTNEKIKITGFDNSKIGNCEITVEFEGNTAKFDVEVVKKQINGIQITKNPTKNQYIQNYENIDLTGGIITIIYNDQSTDTMSMTNEKIKITGFDNSKIGNCEITVEYEERSSKFNVEIVKKNISEVQIITKPVKNKYIQNYEELDLTEGVINIVYNDQSTDTMSMTNEKIKITGFDNSKIGNCEITVEYEGKIAKFNVEVVKKQINGIRITTNPTKNNYIQNFEELDLTGGIITIIYNDQSTDTMSMMNDKIKIIGYDNSKIGNCEVTVEYEGNIAKFNVKIVKNQIREIKVAINPNKKYYIQNRENLDLTGGIITIIYNDQSTDTMSMTNDKIKITGFDNTKIGSNNIYIEYEGFVTSFAVEVIENNDSSKENAKGNENKNEFENTSIDYIIPNDKHDKTMSLKVLPNTGIKGVAIILALLLSGIGGLCCLKYNKYNFQ